MDSTEELLTRFELVTSSLPRTRSTTELQQQTGQRPERSKRQAPRQRKPASEALAGSNLEICLWSLPLFGQRFEFAETLTEKRVKGIEPSSQAWKASALPLSYTRSRGRAAIIPNTEVQETISASEACRDLGLVNSGSEFTGFARDGSGRIRTCEGIATRFTVWPL